MQARRALLLLTAIPATLLGSAATNASMVAFDEHEGRVAAVFDESSVPSVAGHHREGLAVSSAADSSAAPPTDRTVPRERGAQWLSSITPDVGPGDRCDGFEAAEALDQPDTPPTNHRVRLAASHSRPAFSAKAPLLGLATMAAVALLGRRRRPPAPINRRRCRWGPPGADVTATWAIHPEPRRMLGPRTACGQAMTPCTRPTAAAPSRLVSISRSARYATASMPVARRDASATRLPNQAEHQRVPWPTVVGVGALAWAICWLMLVLLI